MAIYNILVVGGIAYFLGSFLGDKNTNIRVILFCTGIFISSCTALACIVLPRVLVAAEMVTSSAKTFPAFQPSSSQPVEMAADARLHSKGEDSLIEHEPESVTRERPFNFQRGFLGEVDGGEDPLPNGHSNEVVLFSMG